MSFTRTPSGIANQFLFYNVDMVVFTEGGNKSFTIEQIKSNEYNEKSVDIIFWKKLFNKFKSDLNLKFKSVGSKSTIRKIAIEIQERNINTAIATMDNEFDRLRKKKINHSNIIYTRGYSWENDVLNSNLMISILSDLSGHDFDTKIIENVFTGFINEISDSVYADVYLSKFNESFLPRKGHLKCVDCSLESLPKIKKVFLKRLFKEKNLNINSIKRYGKIYKIDVKNNCYGHLLFDFFYHIVRYISTKIFEIRIIPKELLERLIISKFLDFSNKETSNYYKLQIENITLHKSY